MKSLTIKRIVKTGFTGFFRNIWVSIAATSMVVITLFIISTLLILYSLMIVSINNSTDKVGVVTAYFSDKTTPQEIENVKTEIQSIPGVKSVEYISKDQAKANFLERHKNEPTWIQTISEFADNPVPASISVKASNLTDYANIYNTIQSERYKAYFQIVRDNQNIIDKLHKFIDLITRFGLILAIIFMVITVMVTFNTIRLTIYNRREEVEIMRLVGATNAFITWPFFIEGILYALIATVITALAIFGLLKIFSSRIEFFFGIDSIRASLVNAVFWKTLEINIAASIVLTIIASSVAIRKYLKI